MAVDIYRPSSWNPDERWGLPQHKAFPARRPPLLKLLLITTFQVRKANCEMSLHFHAMSTSSSPDQAIGMQRL